MRTTVALFGGLLGTFIGGATEGTRRSEPRAGGTVFSTCFSARVGRRFGFRTFSPDSFRAVRPRSIFKPTSDTRSSFETP